MQKIIKESKGLDVIDGEATDILITSDCVKGVYLNDVKVLARAVIITTGTFLNGIIHIGHDKVVGGRIGENSSVKLAEKLYELGIVTGRLKTGTPPRILKSSINWGLVNYQDADKEPEMFSFLHDKPFNKQIQCGITFTNPETHRVIEKNLHKSAIYGGVID